MHDIWEPELHQRISQFIQRKAHEYPELDLTNRWDKYEYQGRPRQLHRPRKHRKQVV